MPLPVHAIIRVAVPVPEVPPTVSEYSGFRRMS